MRFKAVINVIAIYIVILLCASSAYAGKSIPRGWRIPTSKEMQAEYDQWRNRDKNRFLLVEGDFNGDGVIDEARLLLSKKDAPRLGLFAFVSQKDGSFKTFLLIERDDQRYFEALGIEKVSPGEYLTVRGKGIIDYGPDKVRLMYDGINFFKEGSASMYFYWDPQTKDFKKAYIDD